MTTPTPVTPGTLAVGSETYKPGPGYAEDFLPMVRRWTYVDPVAMEVYQSNINPNKMTKLNRKRNITAKGTTSPYGADLVFEGRAAPIEWTYSGEILSGNHYAQLQYWRNKDSRLVLYDHFGRPISLLLTDFDAQPKLTHSKYWRHTYTMTALVFWVGEPASNGVPYAPSGKTVVLDPNWQNPVPAPSIGSQVSTVRPYPYQPRAVMSSVDPSKDSYLAFLQQQISVVRAQLAADTPGSTTYLQDMKTLTALEQAYAAYQQQLAQGASPVWSQ